MNLNAYEKEPVEKTGRRNEYSRIIKGKVGKLVLDS